MNYRAIATCSVKRNNEPYIVVEDEVINVFRAVEDVLTANSSHRVEIELNREILDRYFKEIPERIVIE